MLPAQRVALTPVTNLAAITCYFNPSQCPRQRDNALVFLQHINVPTWVVELSFDGKWDIPQSDRVIRISGEPQQLLWQKECLLNIAEQHVPPEFDAIAWIDADLIFMDNDWSKKTLECLSDNHVCQPWSYCYERHPLQPLSKVDKPACTMAFATGAYNYNDFSKWHPGFAWAMRRDTWREIGGLYEFNVVGNGDTTMTRGFFGCDQWCDKVTPIEMLLHMNDWRNNASRVIQRRVGSVAGDIHHLWHGDRVHRRYVERLTWLYKGQFNPKTDCRRADNGLLEWTKYVDPTIPANVRGYFAERTRFSVHERLGDLEHADVEAAVRSLGFEPV